MEERIINKYIIEQKDNYVSGFYNVNDGEEYDYEGQMADFPDVCEGWYKFQKGKFVVDEKRKQEILDERQKEEEMPTQIDIIEAQTFYTAMMTDTLLEEV